MKAGFVTCVQFGLSCMEDIYEIGGKLEVIITLNDRKYTKKSGRIYLDDFSEQHRVDLIKVNSINDLEVLEAIKKYELEWLFIIGWGWIAGAEVIAAPKLGCIGWHPSKLPVGRGRASIPWAILMELEHTAVTLFKLDHGVDTGAIIKQLDIKLTPTETATTLYEKVICINKKLIQSAWKELETNQFQLIEQENEKATYWAGRVPEGGLLESTMTVAEADRLIRATTKPFPGAYITNGDQKMIIWSAEINFTECITGPYLKMSDGYLLVTQMESA